jgi:hypothetical protein
MIENAASIKMSNQSVIILRDNVLTYVALRGSGLDVDKETRRFVAASKDTAVKSLSKNTGYDREDLIQILSAATVGETREYERGAWVYVPENPRDHPNLIRFYKKYHPNRYLETVIHGYPRYFSEEDIRTAPKTLPKGFIEYLLRRGSNREIIYVARALIQHNTEIPGLEKYPTLTKSLYRKFDEKSVQAFLSNLIKNGIHVDEKFLTQVLYPKNPLFVEEYLAYEKYMHSANADNYNNGDQKRAAQLLAEGFQTTTPPDEPLTKMPDPNFPPTEVAEVFEYYLYYGSDSEIDRVAKNLILHSTELDFNLKPEIERFLCSKHDGGFTGRVYSQSDLLTVLTNVNPRTIDWWHRLEHASGVLTLLGHRNSRKPPPEKDIRDHPALAKYYRHNLVLNYLDLLTQNCCNPLRGALLLDEIEAMCPANLMEQCLQYGTKKEVHAMVETIFRKYDTELAAERDHPVVKKEEDGLYTRSALRQLLKVLPHKTANFDPNEENGVCGMINRFSNISNDLYNEIYIVRYASQESRDAHVHSVYAHGDARVRALVEEFGPPPYTKEQHRSLVNFISIRP